MKVGKQKVLYLLTDLSGELQNTSMQPGSKDQAQQEVGIRAISQRGVMSQAQEWCQIFQQYLTTQSHGANSGATWE